MINKNDLGTNEENDGFDIISLTDIQIPVNEKQF